MNYDETNMSDELEKTKVIVKRGVKHPERVMNYSKTAISLMITGTADGNILPPYIVYKFEHLWDFWTVGGPSGCRYNRSNSG